MPSSLHPRGSLFPLSLIALISHLLFPYMASAAILETDSFESGLGRWINVVSEDSHDWVHHTGITKSPGTGPLGGASDSQHYVYLESSAGSANTTGDTAILQSAFFNETQTATLTFHYHMYGANTGTLSVDVFSGEVWVNDVWSLSGAQQSASDEDYNAVELDLSAYAVSQICFRAIAAGGYHGDIALDDITIGSLGYMAPSFKKDLIRKPRITQDHSYSHSVSNDVIYESPENLIYTKISGPNWLIVGVDGSLSGTPSGADIGSNIFVIEASDGVLSDTTMLVVYVDGVPEFTES